MFEVPKLPPFLIVNEVGLAFMTKSGEQEATWLATAGI